MSVRIIVYLGTAYLAWLGLSMVLGPQVWFEATPGVEHTGGYNGHFIIDIGFAFLVSAVLLAIGAWRASRGLMLAGLAWPVLHAGFHVFELAVHGPASLAALVTQGGGVILPVIVLAVAAHFTAGLAPGAGHRTIMHRFLKQFERQWNYDASYQHEIIDMAPQTVEPFMAFQSLASYRGTAPDAVLAGATLAAVLHEDCGPCAQLNVDMLLSMGAPAAELRALIARDFDAASQDGVTGFRFAEALIARHPDCERLRAQLVEHHGSQAPLAVAYAVLVTRSYPLLKRALGHAQSCQRLDVDGENAKVGAP